MKLLIILLFVAFKPHAFAQEERIQLAFNKSSQCEERTYKGNEIVKVVPKSMNICTERGLFYAGYKIYKKASGQIGCQKFESYSNVQGTKNILNQNFKDCEDSGVYSTYLAFDVTNDMSNYINQFACKKYHQFQSNGTTYFETETIGIKTCFDHGKMTVSYSLYENNQCEKRVNVEGVRGTFSAIEARSSCTKNRLMSSPNSHLEFIANQCTLKSKIIPTSKYKTFQLKMEECEKHPVIDQKYVSNGEQCLYQIFHKNIRGKREKSVSKNICVERMNDEIQAMANYGIALSMEYFSSNLNFGRDAYREAHSFGDDSNDSGSANNQ